MFIKKQLGFIAILSSSLLVGCPPTPTPAPIVTELIVNGGFEALNEGWKYSSNKASRGTLASCIRSGAAYGSLNTQGDIGEPEIGQFIVIPDKGTTILKFSVRVSSEEAPSANLANVRLFVGSGEALEGATLTTANTRDTYVTRQLDISNRQFEAVQGGQRVEVFFIADFRGTKPTTFCIDDVSVKNTQ